MPALADRDRKLLDLSFGEIPPRIEAPGLQRIERDDALAFDLELGPLALADQRGKAPPEPHLVHACSHDGLLVSAAAFSCATYAARIRRSRSITSEASLI